MRWSLMCLLVVINSSFAQITVQGTVKSSNDQAVSVIDAFVQFFKLDITGLDTVKSLLGSARTDLNGHFSFQIATLVQNSEHNLPQKFELSGNYPNPFEGETKIGLYVQKPENFSISIVNILGQQVASIQKSLYPGPYSIHWQGSDIPGVYFAIVQTGTEKSIVKLIQLTPNRNSLSLNISSSSGSTLSKQSSDHGVTLTSYLQVLVSKEQYQNFSSSLLPFTDQSLNIALTYIGSSSVITDLQRKIVLAELGARFTSLITTLPRAEAARQMADYLRTQPEFEHAGASGDGNVWGQFTDGRLVIYVNNRDLAAIPPISLGKSNYASGMTINDDRPPSNIPESKDVFMCAVLDGEGDNVAHLTELMGYNVAKYCDTVDELKTLGNAGICHFNTHAGYGFNSKFAQIDTLFCLWTSTVSDPDLDKKYKTDLDLNRLVYMFAETSSGGTVVLESHYAFTKLFVKEYMSFAPNSLVFANACSSASNDALINTFFGKGASVYVGWTQGVDHDKAAYSATLFYDRLLGANDLVSALPGYVWKEDPPQRPFDWNSVLSWMQSKNYDYGDNAGNSRLVIIPKPGIANPCGPLAPSIASIFVHPYEEKLYLYGIFGDNPDPDGQVTVAKMPRQILEWGFDDQVNMDKIVCKIPNDGADSYGEVQVIVRGIKSNITQLSRYKGDFTLTHDSGDGRKYEVKLTLQFRVHLLGFRTEPGKKPIFNQNTYVVHADMASTGESTASGTTGGAVTWSGHDTDLQNNIDGSANPKGFIAGAWFDPEQHKVQIYLSGVVKDGITQIMGSTSIKTSIIFGVDDFDGKHENFPSYFEIPLQDDFSLKKSSASAKKVGFPYAILKPGTDTVKIEWEDIKCEAPPELETPRSKQEGSLYW